MPLMTEEIHSDVLFTAENGPLSLITKDDDNKAKAVDEIEE